MLVLRRKAGQKIKIGENIYVEIVSVDKTGEVKLTIDAPREIPVIRTELLESPNPKERQVG